MFLALYTPLPERRRLFVHTFTAQRSVLALLSMAMYPFVILRAVVPSTCDSPPPKSSTSPCDGLIESNIDTRALQTDLCCGNDYRFQNVKRTQEMSSVQRTIETFICMRVYAYQCIGNASSIAHHHHIQPCILQCHGSLI